MDLAAFREAGHDAIDRICLYFQNLESNSIPVTVPMEPGSLRRHIPDGPPVNGECFSDIIRDFEQIILPGCIHWQHPGFFGFFPANSTFESIIADMYSSAINNPGFNWSCSPIATDLEFIMMDWVADLLGLDELYKSSSKKGGGIIMGTASEAFLTMCIAARERAITYSRIKSSIDESSTNLAGTDLYRSEGNRDSLHNVQPGDRTNLSHSPEKFVIYGSSEAHSMGSKAAKILGLCWKSVAVGAEDEWKLTGKALRERIEEDVSNSLIPCMLLVTLGGTNFGNVDCLDELVEVARNYPTLWVHVDAAWAGSYLSLEECRQELYLKTINQRPLDNHPFVEANAEQRAYYSQQPSGIVHSFCTNLHKSGLVGFECTTSFVRNKYLIISAIEKSQACLESWEGKAGE